MEANPVRAQLQRLALHLSNEREELVAFLVELAALDRDRRAVELGYSSTLACLVAELSLSETSARRRLTAARIIARFPDAARYLRSGALTLGSLAALKDVLDEDNVQEWLDRAIGKSGREVRDLVATPSAAAAAVKPVTLWLTDELRAELDAVRNLLGHAVPSGKTEDVLLHVLRAQRKVLERRRHGATRKPAATPRVLDGHRIAAAVRREVFDREQGQCTYRGLDGHRCASRRRLEYQHIVPVARGGRSTADNLTLFCRSHNQLQVEKDLGADRVAAKRCEKDAVTALTGLGYPRRAATRAVDSVRTGTGGSDLERLLRAALAVLRLDAPQQRAVARGFDARNEAG